MAHGYVRDIKDLEMRRIAKERLDAAQEAGVEARSVSERIDGTLTVSERELPSTLGKSGEPAKRTLRQSDVPSRLFERARPKPAYALRSRT